VKVILQLLLHLPQRFKEAVLKVAVASEVDASIETAAEAMSHVNEVLAGKVTLGGNLYNVKADWDKSMHIGHVVFDS
jgi:hypothetical protein